MNAPLNPRRTVAELKELRELTGDENGAQRVAFTPAWAKARAWLRRKLEALPAEIHIDEAGNLWATLRGESEKALRCIEQGPVLLDLDRPLGTVVGTFGVERHAVTFHGQAAHAGSTPMNKRKDAFLAAAKMSPEIYRITERHGGVCTIGSCTTKPGFPTSVVEECRLTLDQRHLDAEALARMLHDAKEASERLPRKAMSPSHGIASGRSNRFPFTPISSRSAMKQFPKAAPFPIGCPPVRSTTPQRWPVPAFPV